MWILTLPFPPDRWCLKRLGSKRPVTQRFPCISSRLIFAAAPVQWLMLLPALIIAICLLCGSCALAPRSQEVASRPAERTVHIAASQFGSTVTVAVGDVLKVQRPASYNEWSVDFSHDVLRSLNTEEGRRNPPGDGWTFAVVRRGTSDIAVTPAPTGGTPNVPRFIVTVSAQ